MVKYDPNHPMRSWPLVRRADGRLERQCPHGVGHSDPDYVALSGGGIHGCDGCCAGAYPYRKYVSGDDEDE